VSFFLGGEEAWCIAYGRGASCVLLLRNLQVQFVQSKNAGVMIKYFRFVCLSGEISGFIGLLSGNWEEVAVFCLRHLVSVDPWTPNVRQKMY
jgi:hypothetical protein